MKKSSVDLTQGNILGHILRFAIPILVGQIFQNLYNSVDSIVVGKLVSTTALAAVNASADIAQLLTGFFTGLSAGAGVLFSRCFGAKEHDTLHRAIHTALTFSMIIGVLMAAAGILATPFFLRLVACPADVYEEAHLYLRIYFVGVLFTSIYNVGAGVLRAVGDSRNPLIYLVISGCVNMALDLFFVGGMNLGVAGVGIATILSQLLSVILVAAKMMHTHDVYRLVLSELRIDRTLLRQVMALGLPAAVLNSFVSTSNLFVQRYLNGFGSAAMAGVGAGNKIERFMLMALQSLGLTVGTFVSQNVGAGKYRRAFSGIRVCMVITMAILVVSGIPGWIFARQLAEIFTDDPAAIEYGVLTIRTMFPFLIFQLFNQVLPNAVRGFGRSIAVTTLGMVGMIGCRQIYLAIAMHFAPSVKTVVFGYPVGWFFAATLLAIYYLLVIRIPYGKLAKEERAESDA